MTALALQWIALDGTTFYLTDTVGFSHEVEPEFFSTIVSFRTGGQGRNGQGGEMD